MRHDHDDDRLTVGCPECIRVAREEEAAQAALMDETDTAPPVVPQVSLFDSGAVQ